MAYSPLFITWQPGISIAHLLRAANQRVLLWLPADEREKVIDLLRAVQDRHWHEVWPEPVSAGEAQE